MSPEPDRCAALDTRDGFLPGTSAMHLIARDVRYRQQRGTCDWVAEPANPIDAFAPDGQSCPLSGWGDSPAAAMANLWRKASSGVTLGVLAPSGMDQFFVRWDPERGWCGPERVPS